MESELDAPLVEESKPSFHHQRTTCSLLPLSNIVDPRLRIQQSDMGFIPLPGSENAYQRTITPQQLCELVALPPTAENRARFDDVHVVLTRTGKFEAEGFDWNASILTLTPNRKMDYQVRMHLEVICGLLYKAFRPCQDTLMTQMDDRLAHKGISTESVIRELQR